MDPQGGLIGTTGQDLRLEAVQLRLTQELAHAYDVSYRVHVRTIGWMDWVSNGATAGTTGQGLQVEAIQMRLIEKDGPPVVRWDGADRYEVSANISEANFPAGAHTVYVANGLASADALAAVPLAGGTKSPILLVKRDGIPASVAAELARLNPTDIVILGGERSVSAAVASRLERFATGSVARFGGADRYEVSATISTANFPGADTVYVANGLASADALAAGPVAVGPILLVKKDGIPASVASALASLDPSTVVILGGEGSVSPAAATRLATYATDVVRWDGADRYEVSANISSANLPDGTGTVFVANGLAAADALAAGPVAAMSEGPIVLVKKDGIPTTVADEIERLAPTRIVILGGTGSVSDYALNSLTW